MMTEDEVRKILEEAEDELTACRKDFRISAAYRDGLMTRINALKEVLQCLN